MPTWQRVRRRLSFDALSGAATALLPDAALAPALGASLGSLDVALCLHRVAPPAPTDSWLPETVIPSETLDALIERLTAPDAEGRRRRLTVSFDDGYSDAAAYVASRALRFPAVEFLYFVCPEKSERRAGFRWDAVELARRRGLPLRQARTLMSAPFELEQENRRGELAALGDDPRFRLATVAELRDLWRLPNVTLGSHTSLHAKASELPLTTFVEDVERSQADFQRLLGRRAAHFAFPFGTPGRQFDSRHVRAVRAAGAEFLWSTEARPFSASERQVSGVLPRFPVDGSAGVHRTLGWIAARALRYRTFGTRHRFGLDR